MNEPQHNQARGQLRALLAIPERLLTDAQWDEINELEISLTAINRVAHPNPAPAPRAAPRAAGKSRREQKLFRKPLYRRTNKTAAPGG